MATQKKTFVRALLCLK